MAEPPTYLPVQPSAIPLELREIDCWVNWRAEWRMNREGTGKWTKLPCQANGRQASSTNAATWSTFDAVVAAYHTGKFSGIGWVLQPPFCGIDFDDCFGPSGELKPDVRRWIAAFDSYTERSVSNTGLHVIVRADLPPFGHKAGPFEAYNTGRFFTVSGHRLDGTRPTIEARTEQVRAFCVEKFGGLQSPAASSPATRITPKPPSGRYAYLGTRTRAWLASTGPAGGKPSASEADAAAAAALIVTGRTDAEALALLLDSPRGQDALMRKGTGGMAYLQRTVRNAAAFVGPVGEHPCGLRVHARRLRRPTAITPALHRPGAPL